MVSEKQKKRRLLVTAMLVLFDIIIINFAYLLALLLRFDLVLSEIPARFLAAYLKFAPLHTLFTLGVFAYFKLYQMLLRYASYGELRQITIANLVSIAFHLVGITLLFGRMPISYFVFGSMCQYGLTVLFRFSYRFFLKLKEHQHKQMAAPNHINVMIIGAGAAGKLIAEDILRGTKVNFVTRCFIDDDPLKWNRYIGGVPIVGGRDAIQQAVEQYALDTIIVAIPSADASNKKDILNICKDTGCELKIVPGLYQLINGEVSVSSLKNVEIEDLLGREPVQPEDKDHFQYLEGKTILVTGGGGSIGSELCRQIAAHNPKLLIIFDVYENNAYEIQNELRRNKPELNFITLIGSVRDFGRVKDIFETYRPNIVYHAAAHKHVPLMEDSPGEAIKNNVMGTYNTAVASLLYGAKRFILISTDKAVNPTNIMGASKRIAEKVVQGLDNVRVNRRLDLLPAVIVEEESGQPIYFKPCEHLPESQDLKTEFVAVRFGNVLGSNGSVVPLFKKQITEGGPVTVTHPDIVRYFMTIKEAVILVLLAGNMAKGGEIFVLDMGEPVKIDHLARNLIKLSGKEPGVDIEIRYTGLRPGEKLYEEKLMAEEGLTKTDNQLICIAKPLDFDVACFFQNLEGALCHHQMDLDEVKQLVNTLTSTYQEASLVNAKKIAELH